MLRSRSGVQVDYPQTKTIPFLPVRGLNTEVPADQLEPGFSPNCQNVYVRHGRLIKRPGPAQYGADLSGSAAAIVGAKRYNSWYKWVLTSTKIYIWDILNVQWTQIGADGTFAWFNPQIRPGLEGYTNVLGYRKVGLGLAAYIDDTGVANHYNSGEVFADRCVITEYGVGVKPVFRWSTVGQNDVWTGAGSGVTTIETWGSAQALLRYGTGVLLYTSDGIHAISMTGVSSGPFRIEPVSRVATPWGATVAEGPAGAHIFFGTDDVFIVNNYTPVVVSGRIRQKLLADIDPLRGLTSPMAFWHEPHQEYYLYFPLSRMFWVYCLQHDAWFRWYLGHADAIMSHMYSVPFGETQTVTSGSPEIGSVNTITGPGTRAYRWNDDQDIGNNYDTFWESHDFTSDNVFGVAGYEITLIDLTIDLYDVSVAATLAIEASSDPDAGWTSLQSTSTYTGTHTNAMPVRITKQFTGQKIRLRLRSTGEGFWSVGTLRPRFEIRGMPK